MSFTHNNSNELPTYLDLSTDTECEAEGGKKGGDKRRTRRSLGPCCDGEIMPRQRPQGGEYSGQTARSISTNSSFSVRPQQTGESKSDTVAREYVSSLLSKNIVAADAPLAPPQADNATVHQQQAPRIPSNSAFQQQIDGKSKWVFVPAPTAGSKSPAAASMSSASLSCSQQATESNLSFILSSNVASSFTPSMQVTMVNTPSCICTGTTIINRGRTTSVPPLGDSPSLFPFVTFPLSSTSIAGHIRGEAPAFVVEMKQELAFTAHTSTIAAPTTSAAYSTAATGVNISSSSKDFPHLQPQTYYYQQKANPHQAHTLSRTRWITLLSLFVAILIVFVSVSNANDIFFRMSSSGNHQAKQNPLSEAPSTSRGVDADRAHYYQEEHALQQQRQHGSRGQLVAEERYMYGNTARRSQAGAFSQTSIAVKSHSRRSTGTFLSVDSLWPSIEPKEGEEENENESRKGQHQKQLLHNTNNAQTTRSNYKRESNVSAQAKTNANSLANGVTTSSQTQLKRPKSLSYHEQLLESHSERKKKRQRRGVVYHGGKNKNHGGLKIIDFAAPMWKDRNSPDEEYLA